MTDDTSKRVESHLETIRAELARMSSRSVGSVQTIARRDPRKRLIDDRYELERQIGTGGMGVVFLALDKKLERHVAIKRLVVKSYNARTVQRRFLREAQAIAQMGHYNIVNIFDVGQDEEGHYIVMEYIPGPVVSSKVKVVEPAMPLNLHGYVSAQGPMPLEDAVRFMRKVANALEYAHRQGIIHRDVKPTNILITKDFDPKLLDFGLARPMNLAKSEEITLDGSVLGTPEYCAPEQWNDASGVDVRADIYALAGVFWFALSGRSPRYFRENDVDPMIAPILCKGLASKPDQRYDTVQDLVDALDEMVEQASVMVEPVPTTAELTASQGFWVCRHCEATNTDSAKFCNHCGASGLDTCPNCATQYRAGNQHCPGCGVDVKLVEECATLLSTARDHASFSEFETALEFLTEDIRQNSPEARKLYKEWVDKILARRNLMMEMDGALRVFNTEKAIDLAVQLKVMVPEECLSESADFKAASNFSGMLEELKQMLIEGANRARQDFNLARFSQNIQYLNRVFEDDVCHVINMDLQQVEMLLDDALTQAGLAAGMNCFGRAQETLETVDPWKGAELGNRRTRLSTTCKELVEMRERAIEETERAVSEGRFSEALALLKETSRFRLPPNNSEITPGKGDRGSMDRIIKIDKALMTTIEESIGGWVRNNDWDNIVNALGALKGSESSAWKKLVEKLRAASNQEIVKRYNLAIELEKKGRLRKSERAWQDFLTIPQQLTPGNLFQYASEYSRRMQGYRRKRAEKIFSRYSLFILVLWLAFVGLVGRKLLFGSEAIKEVVPLAIQLSTSIVSLVVSLVVVGWVRTKSFYKLESRWTNAGLAPRITVLAVLTALSPLACLVYLLVDLTCSRLVNTPSSVPPEAMLGIVAAVWLIVDLFNQDGLPAPSNFGLFVSWILVAMGLSVTLSKLPDASMALQWGGAALAQGLIFYLLIVISQKRIWAARKTGNNHVTGEIPAHELD